MTTRTAHVQYERAIPRPNTYARAAGRSLRHFPFIDHGVGLTATLIKHWKRPTKILRDSHDLHFISGFHESYWCSKRCYPAHLHDRRYSLEKLFFPHWHNLRHVLGFLDYKHSLLDCDCLTVNDLLIESYRADPPANTLRYVLEQSKPD